jgi:S-adenosylmethionine synthetase
LIYKNTAAYGHFGRELPEFKWEKINKVGEMRRDIKGMRRGGYNIV